MYGFTPAQLNYQLLQKLRKSYRGKKCLINPREETVIAGKQNFGSFIFQNIESLIAPERGDSLKLLVRGSSESAAI